MDAGAVVGADSLLSSAPPTPATPLLSRWTHRLSQLHQHLLDKSAPHVLRRWVAFAAVALVYLVRVYVIQGFYIVSYGLGIYIISLLIGFLSPQVDPEIDASASAATSAGDGPTLPVRRTDEFRPFVRRLPEFKFWYSIIKGFIIAFVMTFFSVLDIPVFWPILLFYWIVLFTLTMRKQISHMIKYKYVPFSTGKQQYDKRKPAATESTSLSRD